MVATDNKLQRDEVAEWARWLESLLDRPAQEGPRWTISAIQKSTGVSRATLHAILGGSRKAIARGTEVRLARLRDRTARANTVESEDSMARRRQGLPPEGTLGFALRRARQATGLSQSALGEAIGGVHKDTVSAWERNDNVPDPPRATALTAFFAGKEHGSELAAALARPPQDRRSGSTRSSGGFPPPSEGRGGIPSPEAANALLTPAVIIRSDEATRALLAETGLGEVPGMVAREVAHALAMTIRAHGGEMEKTKAGLYVLADALDAMAERLSEADYSPTEIIRAARKLRARAEAF